MKNTTTQHTTFAALKDARGYSNVMQAPKVAKVIVSVGVGSVKDKKRQEFIAGRLTRITGQKPAPRATRKSIATFKTRVGDLAGYQITLRGKRANDFLQKLIHVVLPRVKDFRGLSPKAIDEMGNMTIGIKEHTVFPETADEDAKDVFGFAVTIATTATNKEDAEAFLRHIGVPLKKGE